MKTRRTIAAMQQFMTILVAVGFVLAAMGGAHEAAGAMAVSQASSAPTSNVVISQTAADTALAFRWNQPAGSDRNPRDQGQTFLSSGFVLDKVSVNLSALATSAYDSQPVTLEIQTFSNASDFTPDSTVATESGNFASNMKSSFDSGDTYLTFDISDVTLTAGQQYGFLLMHGAQQSSADNMLVAAEMNSAYTSGIGVRREYRGTGSDNYAESMGWDGQSQPADLEFYLQEAPPADGDIPEPATMAMLGLAFAGLGAYARKRRRETSKHLLTILVAVGLVLAAAGGEALATPVTGGLEMWLKADAITGLSDGQAVSTWADSWTSNNDATQGTSARRPSYETGELNGLPVVRFDGNDDAMNLPGNMFNLGSVTAFVVGNYGPVGAKKQPFVGGSRNGVNNTRFFILRDQSSQTGNAHYSVANQNPAVQFAIDEAPHVHTLRDDSAQTVNVEAWVDGMSRGTANTSKPNASIDTLWLGAMSPGQSWASHLSGDIAEVLLYDRPLTEAERTSVGAYLADKYGLSYPKPGDVLRNALTHQYKFDADATDAKGGTDGAFVGDAAVAGGGPVGPGYLELDGNGDWVSFGANQLTPSGSTVSNPVTIAGWVRFDGATKANPFDTRNLGSFYAESSGGNVRYNFDGRADQNNGQIAIDQFPASGGSWFGASNTGFADFDWHHVAYVQSADSPNRQLFIDGMPFASSGTPENYTGGTSFDVAIGSRTGANGKEPDAGMDDWGFWNEAVSAEAIALIHGLAVFEGLDLGDAGIPDVLDAYYAQSSAQAGAHMWAFAQNLPSNTLGAIGGSIGTGDAYIVLDPNGGGVQVQPDGDIPEPATMAMLGLAVLGLGGYIRRRRHA